MEIALEYKKIDEQIVDKVKVTLYKRKSNFMNDNEKYKLFIDDIDVGSFKWEYDAYKAVQNHIKVINHISEKCAGEVLKAFEGNMYKE